MQSGQENGGWISQTHSKEESALPGGGSHVEVRRDELGVRWWSPENRKSHLAISSASEAHVFDAVLKHGWPSAPCHGAIMAEKKV